MIYSVDSIGNPGHPTKRFGQVRKLRKSGIARITGGGLSGTPTIVKFLTKTFDTNKTVNRKFSVLIDPGYRTAGFAVCEVIGTTLKVLLRGTMDMRIPEIKGLMQDCKMHRRARRYISRSKAKRLSAKQDRVLTKFKKPRNIRSKDKSNATLKHGVEVHLNLYGIIRKLCPLPIFQTVNILEQNTFNIRTMTWGQTNGNGYQQSPRTDEPTKECLLCGIDKGLHKHHLVPRKKKGTNVKENLIYLCSDCHTDFHAGKVYLPMKGQNIAQWRALGTMNAITGVLNKVKGLHFVPASDMAIRRRELGINKEHGNDAVCAAAALFGCTTIDDSTAICVSLKKSRRHNRARTHALRERNYKLDGKTVAQNRNKRFDQKTDSIAELRATNPSIIGKLAVYPGIRLINPIRINTPTIGGDTWMHQGSGKLFTSTGILSGKYLFSPGLKKINGKNYIHPDHCSRIHRNKGYAICTN